MRGFGTYLRAAFNARPLGMPIPPNWLALAAAGLLGWFIHPGLWLIAGGLELGYLFALTNNARFRRAVDADAGSPVAEASDRRQELVQQLDAAGQDAQQALDRRCQAILALVPIEDPLRERQEEQLCQLSWLHLRLLAARSAVATVTRTAQRERGELTRKLADLERRRDAAAADLASSIEGQAAIVRTRLAQFDEAEARLAYLEAERERLGQQAELLKEQNLLAAGGSGQDGISTTIAHLGDSLATTNRWMREQRLTLDIGWEEAPPLPMPAGRGRKTAASA
jgi:hypothetical protein